MKKHAGRWLDVIGVFVLVGALLTLGTGCGALKAAANPKVAWAINDPAPMSVVVRRADVAEKTSKEVDRLMTDTPANDDSAWLAHVGPEKDTSTKDMVDLKSNDLYATGGARVVAAEVWAKELSQVEPKNAVAGSGSAKPAAPTAPAKDQAVAQNDAAAPTPKEAKLDTGATTKQDNKKSAKGSKKGKKGKKGAPAPAADTTVASADTTPAPAPAAADPAPAATTTTAATATPAKYTSLLAAIDADLGSEWSKVMDKKKAMGDAKGQIAVLEAANDEKGISDSDKKANKAKIDDLDKQVDALESDANKLSKEFIPKAKTAASKAAPEVRDHFGATLVNLRAAVGDADISNSAAAIRYPLAASSILSSAKQMAKVYVADVIEEKTGKRPSTATLQPGVTMEGGSVQVTLNGLSSSDMGKLSVGDVTTEVASRTSVWAKRAFSLLGVIASTKEVLSFEDDVLAALIDGFTSAGWKAPAAAVIPEAPKGPAAGQPRS